MPGIEAPRPARETAPTPRGPVGPADLEGLPAPASRMMRFHHVLGQPRPRAVAARAQGRARPTPGAPWHRLRLDLTLQGLPAPRRRATVVMRALGLPWVGRADYDGRVGRACLRPLDLFDLVDGRGPDVDRSELAGWLHSALLLAPAMLLHPAVQFQGLDPDSFELVFVHADREVRLRVFVAADGSVTDVHTRDCVLCLPGEAPQRVLWTTPVEGWRWLDGHMRPTRAQAIWRPDGAPPFPCADVDFRAGWVRLDASGGAAVAPA